MITQEQFDRTLAGWFEADAGVSSPAGALDQALGVTRRHRPRPAWFAALGGHWIGEPYGSAPRTLAPAGLRWSTVVLLALLALALAGAAVLLGSRLLHTSLPPTGHLGRLAYGNVDGDGDSKDDIFLADWDGGNAFLVASSAGQSAVPEACRGFFTEGGLWSPDGRHLAYRTTWSDACPGSVYISDPDGTHVVSFPGAGWTVGWSPDSSRIVTWVDDGKVGVYGIDGTRYATLTVPDGAIAPGDSDPWWSQDGKYIVVKGGFQVAVDGTGNRRPSNPDGVLSPDGKRLAFTTWVCCARSLWIGAADGSNPRALFSIPVLPDYSPGFGCPACDPGNISDITWSPAGDRLAFQVDGRTMTDQAIVNGLYVVDTATDSVTVLVNRGNAALHVIEFSPEGDRILYRRQTDPAFGRGNSLWTIRVDGSDNRLVVDGTGWGDWQWVAN